jgi:mannan endo-1,4-beta-mannosidase
MLGESVLYSYKFLGNEGDIGALLDNSLNDSKIAIIVYNWTTKQAYQRTGFNLNDNNDYILNNDWTTFIIKNKMIPTQPTPTPAPISQPTPTPAPVFQQTVNVGDTFKGLLFEQDPKPNFIKINGVMLGQSIQYSYKIINNVTDIGAQLDLSVNDSRAVVLNYNWTTKQFIVKTGFNLSDSSDSILNNDWTTFIIKNKINTTPVSQPMPMPVPTLNSNFLTISNGNFILNGSVWHPVGFNAYWQGIFDNNQYPTYAQIDEMMKAGSNMKATCIRSHTLAASFGMSNSLLNNSLQFNQNAWKTIDYAIYKAKLSNIKLLIPLTDCYSYASGSYKIFTDYAGVSKDEFWNNDKCKTLYKNFVSGWLNHTNSFTNIKNLNEPTIILETGNEFNYRPDSNSNTYPSGKWTGEMCSYIKSIAPTILVMSGNDENLQQSGDFQQGSVDIFSSHFYSEDYNRINNDAQNSINVGRPYVTGEYDPRFSDNWFKNLENNKNIKGSLFWSMFPHDNNGNRVEHNDGFTQWFDSDNNDIILKLSNHYRRMQGLPTVSNINY